MYVDKLISITTNEQGSKVVSARELKQFLEVGTHVSTWINRLVDKYQFDEGIDFSILKSGNTNGGVDKIDDFAITLDMAKEIAMLQGNDKGKQARKYFIEAEKQLKEIITASYLITDPIKRAEAWIEEQKQLQIAVATKAEIGSRREATAMATASVQTRRANKLKIELDESREYCTVKRMQMIYHGQSFDWRVLKSTGIEMGVEAREVFDANYGTVKSYHKSVWEEAYKLTF